MHRPTLAFAVAGLLAENLSHHRLELTALGDQVSVTAVRAGDVVLVGERRAHTCRRGFLTNRHMHEAGHFALFEQVTQTFFELADRLHGTVHLEQFVLANLCGCHTRALLLGSAVWKDGPSLHSPKPGEWSILRLGAQNKVPWPHFSQGFRGSGLKQYPLPPIC